MMFDNHIKESPFLGFAGFGGGISWDSIQKYIDTVYYVEEAFSTYVYEGDGTTQTITNDINLTDEGGMVWIKNRDQGDSHAVVDTKRGINKIISTDSDALESANTSVAAFNSDGFDVGSGTPDLTNVSGENYASWTFRKTPGFFDVVTYTGDGVAGRTVAHNLGSVPGMIWVKKLDTAVSWLCYHRSTGAGQYMLPNLTNAALTDTTAWNDTEPTSTEFSVGTAQSVNASGATYVAYLFAHDDARFGDNNDQSIIKCGTYTGNGLTAGPTINLGWEPQWVLIKSSAGVASNWQVMDNIRGLTYQDTDKYFLVNTAATEAPFTILDPLHNGFQINSSNAAFNSASGTYIYMAIRRGPMKTPTDATTVFAAAAGQNVTTAGDLMWNSGFPIDWIIENYSYGYDRFMPTYDYYRPYNASASNTDAGYRSLVSNEGSPYDITFDWTTAVAWCFRRAPGFFDMAAYTGTGSTKTVGHSLGVAPELMIVKSLSATTSWGVYAAPLGATQRMFWDTNAAAATRVGFWNNNAPTSSVFTVGTTLSTNNNIYHAYLFASLDGISKVGTYTGNAGAQNIDCGFSAGARFVMIKRTDVIGDWYVFDTTEGIVTGSETYSRINASVPVTGQDYIDPFSSGFALNSNGSSTTNVNGATYIYLAIA